MKKVNVMVRGKSRTVYLEKQLTDKTWQARTYVGSKVVSGTFSRYSNGILRFVPAGINASLV